MCIRDRAKIMGYHVGEAAGLLAGSQTISAVIGVASDTINPVSYTHLDVYKRQQLALHDTWLSLPRNGEVCKKKRENSNVELSPNPSNDY